MQPPFRPALLPAAAIWAGGQGLPFIEEGAAGLAPTTPTETPSPRLRLGEMDPHLHCSVIGTCLSTAELRKLMARCLDVADLSDLDVHHEAVRQASLSPEVSRLLHKALDRRHEASVQRLAKARDAQALQALWQQALDSGEVPGAYWAVLTHRRTTPELRQRVFGDVHMLSHLVGAANRADIRRLVALERENTELRERADRQQERAAERIAELVTERDAEHCGRLAAQASNTHLEQHLQSVRERSERAQDGQATQDTLTRAVALHTRRRDEAENRVRRLQVEAGQLQAELTAVRQHMAELARELGAAEAELNVRSSDTPDAASPLTVALSGRKLLYVGGRPSSSAAIRDLALRHGAEFQRHDGGIEDRKGMLAAALAGASLVVFPVDCIDHDSAQALKRGCQRQGVPFLALRNASVASFAAAVGAWARMAEPAGCGCGRPCLRHS